MTRTARNLTNASIALLLISIVSPLSAQTLHVPGGTVGISSNGNVGIGTTTPGKKLDVNGAIKANRFVGENADILNSFTTVNPSSNVYLYSPPNDRDAWLYLDSADTGSNWGIYHRQIDSSVSNLPANSIGFVGGGNSELKAYISLASGEAFFKGNVGIGTTGPGAKLHVRGATAGEFAALQLDNSQGGLYSTAINLYVNDGSQYRGGRIVTSIVGAGWTDNVMTLQSQLSGGAYDNTLSVRGGNVGIGTTNPTHKLAVNGTIKAKEVIVETTGWSDYVFADGYALQPLSQVEEHIKTNKHLPGIPSASEVATNGVNVGDMQAALLAKVEELTLHLIAQEKELTRLRETERKLAALESKLRQLDRLK